MAKKYKTVEVTVAFDIPTRDAGEVYDLLWKHQPDAEEIEEEVRLLFENEHQGIVGYQGVKSVTVTLK